jgi:hypothetical protein
MHTGAGKMFERTGTRTSGREKILKYTLKGRD